MSWLLRGKESSSSNNSSPKKVALIKSPDVRSQSFDSYLPSVVHLNQKSSTPSSSSTSSTPPPSSPPPIVRLPPSNGTTHTSSTSTLMTSRHSGSHPPPPPIPQFKRSSGSHSSSPLSSPNRSPLSNSMPALLSPQRSQIGNYRTQVNSPIKHSPIERLKQSARRRGVTCAASQESEAENRRISLMGAIDPMTRPRSKSLEILNSWDYQPGDFGFVANEVEYGAEQDYYYNSDHDDGVYSSDANSTHSSSQHPHHLTHVGSSSPSSSSSSSPKLYSSPLSSSSSSPSGSTLITSSLSVSTNNLLKNLSLSGSIRSALTTSTDSNNESDSGSPRVVGPSTSSDSILPPLSSFSTSSSISSPRSPSSNTNKLVFEKNEENKFSVLSGPKDQLMEHLCSKNKPDLSFVYSFILTFHFFMTPEELFDYLMQKYESIPQSTQSIKVSKQFEEIAETIKQNVIIVLLVWIDSNYSDFLDDKKLHSRLIQFSVESRSIKEAIDKQDILKVNLLDLVAYMQNEFFISPLPTSSSSSSNNNNKKSTTEKNQIVSGYQIQEWITKHLNVGNNAADIVLQKLYTMKRIGSIGGQLTSKGKIQKEDSFFFAIPTTIKQSYSKSFLDYHPHDIAKQLTMIEFNLFQQVKLKELYNKAWTEAKTKYERSPNVMALIMMSNKVANWVATEVVTTPHPKKRVEVLKRFITVAEQCKKINNYNTFMEVVSGLNNCAVVRLQDTWRALPSRYINSFRSMQEFISTTENWKHYRNAIKKREVPCLPYLGIFLQDLNFLEDGNANTLPVTDSEVDHINFRKMVLLSNIYKNLQFFQKHPYLSLTSNQNLQTFLDKDMLILPEKELYAFSKFVYNATAQT